MNIESILEQLNTKANEPSAEELFRQKLASHISVEKTAEAEVIEEELTDTEEPETETEPEVEPETEETTEEVTDEDKEVVAELDAKGRVMARAFYDELQKLSAAQNYEAEEIAEIEEDEEEKQAASRASILEKIYYNLNPEDTN